MRTASCWTAACEKKEKKESKMRKSRVVHTAAHLVTEWCWKWAASRAADFFWPSQHTMRPMPTWQMLVRWSNSFCCSVLHGVHLLVANWQLFGVEQVLCRVLLEFWGEQKKLTTQASRVDQNSKVTGWQNSRKSSRLNYRGIYITGNQQWTLYQDWNHLLWV